MDQDWAAPVVRLSARTVCSVDKVAQKVCQDDTPHSRPTAHQRTCRVRRPDARSAHRPPTPSTPTLWWPLRSADPDISPSTRRRYCQWTFQSVFRLISANIAAGGSGVGGGHHRGGGKRGPATPSRDVRAALAISVAYTHQSKLVEGVWSPKSRTRSATKRHQRGTPHVASQPHAVLRGGWVRSILPHNPDGASNVVN